MAQNIIGPDAFPRINFQHLFKEVHGLRVHLLIAQAVQIKSHLPVILVHLLEFPTLEQGPLGEQDVENDSNREDIAHRVHTLPLDERGDFRCDVAGRAAAVEEVVLCLHKRRQAEVHDDRVEPALAAQHYVLGLDVAVHDAVIVDLLEPPREADHELLDLPQRELPLAPVDPAVQLPRRE